MDLHGAASPAASEGRLIYFAENLASLHGSGDLAWLTGRFEFLGEKALGAAVTVLALADESGAFRPAKAAAPRPAHTRDLWTALNIDELADNEAAIALFHEAERRARPAVVELGQIFPGRPSVSGIDSAIVAPISYNRELIGGGIFVTETSDLTVQMAAILADHTAVAVHQLRQREEARRLHSVDPWLWVPDEHFLTAQLRREVLRARRYSREVGLALLRLENEGEIRQRFGDFFTGHLMRRIGAQLFADVRDSDILGALDEAYAVIHTETGADGTRLSAERLAESVALMVTHRFPEIPTPVVSVRTAAYPVDGESAEALVSHVVREPRADVAAA